MTVDERLDALRELIQRDVGNRGFARDPADNLLTHTAGDFAAACRSIAEAQCPVLGIVTGFPIVSVDPPRAETDGPLGALFLAQALTPLGIAVMIGTDPNCQTAIVAGLSACRLEKRVPVLTPPFDDDPVPTHFIAVERVGPSHTPESLAKQAGTDPSVLQRFLGEVPEEHHDRCHNMRGRDITDHTGPAHLLFDELEGEGFRKETRIHTIGIGDGGNEIGMGKVPWDTIRRNIPNGGLIACRVPVDHLIVAGVSNWGAYALAAGVLLLRGEKGAADLFDPDRERELLRIMVEQGLLVDGVSGRATAIVDGLSWEQYAEPLVAMGRLMR
jgi:D-glutamate cyclase